MVEQEEEDKGSDDTGSGNTSVHPDELGVLGHGDQGLGDGRAKGVGEEVQTLDKRLHAGGSLGVGVLETGDGNEDFGQTDKDVGRSLDGNVHVVGQSLAVDVGGVTLKGALVARAGVVDEVLDNGSIAKAHGDPDETEGYSGNGSDLNAGLAQGGVHEHLEERGEDENRDGVKVLHKVVGHAVAVHLAGLGNKVRGELTVANPEDGVKDKDLAGTDGTLQLLDKVVVPDNRLGLAVGSAP